MSRSTRKPYFTQQQFHNKHAKRSKRSANRAIRNLPEDETPANGKAYRKQYQSWDIRDWSFHSPNDKKAYRK